MRRSLRYAPDAAFGAEHFVAQRIEDHAGDQFARPLQRQRHVEHRKSVREIRGAIQRIDVPAIFGRAFLPAAFFGDDGMRRESALRRRSTIRRSLARSASVTRSNSPLSSKPMLPLQIGGDERAGFAGDLGGGFNEGGQERQPSLVQIFDVVFEQEQVRFVVARQPDEVGVVEFDDPGPLPGCRSGARARGRDPR